MAEAPALAALVVVVGGTAGELPGALTAAGAFAAFLPTSSGLVMSGRRDGRARWCGCTRRRTSTSTEVHADGRPAWEAVASIDPWERTVAYRLYRGLLALVFHTLWRPVIEGRENIPADGPVLIAANHLSFIDSIVIPLSVNGRRVTFLAKAEYFTGRGPVGLLRRTVFRVLGAVPVQRDAQRQAQASLDTALEVLHRGWAFGIYPEGTRSRDGRLYRGRTGVAWLALESGAPVVPVGLIGTDQVQPVGARFPRLHRVHVQFGTPIRPKDFADAGSPGLARRRLTDAVMDAIAAMSGQERAPGYNDRGATGI